MSNAGDDQLHHQVLHGQNQQQRPPSEHIYFSIESDYNSTLPPNDSNSGHEFVTTQSTLNTNSVHRPAAVGTQQWRLTGNKNCTQPYMV